MKDERTMQKQKALTTRQVKSVPVTVTDGDTQTESDGEVENEPLPELFG